MLRCFMRTTVTLDPDVHALLERDMAERSVSFKQAVNDAVRAALTGGRRDDFDFPDFDLGSTSYDLTRANQLAAELEDEQTVRDLNLGR